jgi:hypothetical protein
MAFRRATEEEGNAAQMTPDEEIMAPIIQERGYLVVETNLVHEVGQVLSNRILRNWSGNRTDTKMRFYIVCETDREDFLQHLSAGHRIAGLDIERDPQGPRFYRVSTD